MRATIWKDRDRGCWCFVVVGPTVGKAGVRLTWDEALAGALAELDAHRAARK